MATTYKVNTVLDSLDTALTALVSAGTLRAFVRRVVSPLDEIQVPVLGMLAHEYRRAGGPEGQRDWIVSVEMGLAVRQGESNQDTQLKVLAAEVDAVLEAWEIAGTGGATIASYRIAEWYHPSAQNNLSPVGLIFSLELKLEGPLKVVSE